jgi:hypothetical protein
MPSLFAKTPTMYHNDVAATTASVSAPTRRFKKTLMTQSKITQTTT